MAEINLAALLGGVGLFLLGMTMMSGGLKLSLGPALTRRLRDWTNGRLRGLLFGSVATALMQSSTPPPSPPSASSMPACCRWDSRYG